MNLFSFLLLLFLIVLKKISVYIFLLAVFFPNYTDKSKATRWEGSKTRCIGAGLKMYYHGVDTKRNGVGGILKEEDSVLFSVVEMTVGDRDVSVKQEIEGVMDVVSGYSLQVEWRDGRERKMTIPREVRVAIGADFNG